MGTNERLSHRARGPYASSHPSGSSTTTHLSPAEAVGDTPLVPSDPASPTPPSHRQPGHSSTIGGWGHDPRFLMTDIVCTCLVTQLHISAGKSKSKQGRKKNPQAVLKIFKKKKKGGGWLAAPRSLSTQPYNRGSAWSYTKPLQDHSC